MEFISYYPLKQGLKLRRNRKITQPLPIYILLSIKTRIETLNDRVAHGYSEQGFISYYPLKQGLKLFRRKIGVFPVHYLYPTIH